MKKFAFCAVLLLLFTSCASIGRFAFEPQIDVHEESYFPEEFVFTDVKEGKECLKQFHFSNRSFPVRYHIVKIDLKSPLIEFVFFPDSDDMECDSYYKSMRTKKLAEKQKLDLAINFSPFENEPNFFHFKSFYCSTKKIIGLHKVNGKLLSSHEKKYCALAFNEKKDAEENTFYDVRIFASQTDSEIKNYSSALGGFFVILKDGVKQDFAAATHDSRMAVGLDSERRFMYILAVEGEFPRESSGLSYQECAEIFLRLGCTDAMQADGGSSTQMILNGKSLVPSPYTPIQGSSLGLRIRK